VGRRSPPRRRRPNSLTGSVVAAVLYTVFLEVLRPIESPFSIGPINVPGIPGMRMVLFSILLLLVILFYQKGLFGGKEFSWDGLFAIGGKIRARFARASVPPATPPANLKEE